MGEAQNSFPAEHGHRIAQKKDGGRGGRGGQKRPSFSHAPSSCREREGELRVNMSANDNIFQQSETSQQEIVPLLREGKSAGGEGRTVFTRVFKDPAMRQLITELHQ